MADLTEGFWPYAKDGARYQAHIYHLRLDTSQLDGEPSSMPSAILLYRDRLGDRMPELRVERLIRGAGLGGAASLEVVTLPCVQLDGTDLERPAVLLRNSLTGFLPRVNGDLSLTALRARHFSFDFESSTFSRK